MAKCMCHYSLTYLGSSFFSKHSLRREAILSLWISYVQSPNIYVDIIPSHSPGVEISGSCCHFQILELSGKRTELFLWLPENEQCYDFSKRENSSTVYKKSYLYKISLGYLNLESDPGAGERGIWDQNYQPTHNQTIQTNPCNVQSHITAVNLPTGDKTSQRVTKSSWLIASTSV